MIFVRDTSFWGNYNQGIVITNKCLYYIEDNDEPTVVCCPWGFLKNVEFLKDSRAIAFTTKDDPVLFLDCDLFIRDKNIYEDGLTYNAFISIEDLFNDIINWLN